MSLRQMENHERDRDVEAEQGILEAEGLHVRDGEAEDRSIIDPEKTGQEGIAPQALSREQTQTQEDARTRRRKNRHARRDTDVLDASQESQPSSLWYWGPLRRWRLQDSTVYT